MKEFTDEYIKFLLKKHRDFFIMDLEESLCLDCYNILKGLNLTENDVELKDSVCKLCKREKPCIRKYYM